jgi:hypothetical protein
VKNCLATVLIPTTGDRGLLLVHSIKSIQNQTIKDIEIFIIGDGVEEEAKKIIRDLMANDERIKFFDYPKHLRRGEPYRHEVLQHSNGKSIFYLCDRDLMLPNHINRLLKILNQYNFVSSTYIGVKRDQSLNIDQWVNYYGSGEEMAPDKRRLGTLSCIAHTRELYFELDNGWRTTPLDQFTDRYMWKQFLGHIKCRPYSSPLPTILYFKRGHHPGDPIETRAVELGLWASRISTSEGIFDIVSEAMAALLLERNLLRSRYSILNKILNRSKELMNGRKFTSFF